MAYQNMFLALALLVSLALCGVVGGIHDGSAGRPGAALDGPRVAPGPVVSPHGLQQAVDSPSRRGRGRRLLGAASVAPKSGGGVLASPGAGTDISSPIPLLKCHNQTSCIKPYLQLQQRFKVYYCKHVGHGVRFYYLTREGLLQHPLLDMVDSPEEADVVVYLPESAPWKKTECTNPAHFHKTIVLDESDGPQMFDPAPAGQSTKWLLYFKRSFVRRGNGQFQGYMPYLKRNDVLPMSYTIADAYVRPEFNFHRDRQLDIVSTLRGSSRDPCRQRVREWTKSYCETRSKKCVVGQVNSASRRTVDSTYLNNMYVVSVCLSYIALSLRLAH